MKSKKPKYLTFEQAKKLVFSAQVVRVEGNDGLVNVDVFNSTGRLFFEWDDGCNTFDFTIERGKNEHVLRDGHCLTFVGCDSEEDVGELKTYLYALTPIKN